MSQNPIFAVALLGSTALAAPGVAQTLTSSGDIGQVLADQEARIAELEAAQEDRPNLATDVGGVELTFGGRINGAVLSASQGDQDQAFIVDNDASGSRFEFLAESQLDDETRAGLEIVVSAEVNSTDDIDFGSTIGASDEGSPAGDFRQAHFYVENDRLGYISFGQGDTAAEDTAHVDLSGTSFAGAGSDVDDIAGGLVFKNEGGEELAELDDFFDMLDGTRTVRALYVTPDFGGFSFGVSAANSSEVTGGPAGQSIEGSGLQPAVAAYYGNEFAFGEVEAALSWRSEILEDDDESGTGDDVKNRFVVGSASMLFNSGLNVTLAYAQGDIDGRDEDDTAAFVKLGYISDLTSLGESRFSVDYYRGENQPAFGRPGAALDGSENDLVEATSFGVFAVQEIADLNTEAYVGYRRYDLDDVYLSGSETDVDSLGAVIVGARVRF